ncbi:MAG: DEAD/DEAH box helicase [Verrucomicrobia bacterium]|jgi:superfamily II DNA or RNA helicase|nr:DEAD/DEAH box helicase [Verrucomicrobiota bacterium]
MTSPTALTQGDRVFHRDHPEYGFGLVRYVEDDILGGKRIQVDFENLVSLQTALPADLTEAADFKRPDLSSRESDRDAVLRRFLCGVVIGENNLTGAFLHTSTQPLPHQAFALDKILGHKRFGHLLADDVGLGKTIEAGLIVSALRGGNTNYRVLIVAPASLSLQWQDEMEEHFSLHFSVMGRDFDGKRTRSWRNQHLVIASLDALKRPDYDTVLQQVGPFDLVICDEGHRLSAKRELLSQDLEKTQNYRLFERMTEQKLIDVVTDNSGAPRSPRLLLLSATPHQGDNLRFNYLLNLIRPDLFPLPPDRHEPSSFDPHHLKETVTRTPRSAARDWNGDPLFKGHTTLTLDVVWGEKEAAAAQKLTKYIYESLNAEGDSSRQLVVQLVMHTFHKIAASSWAALESALANRKTAIVTGADEAIVEEEEDDIGVRQVQIRDRAKQFFEHELELLEEILAAVRGLTVDSKWQRCSDLLDQFDAHEAGCHVLIFTQYKATQNCLRERLEQRCPGTQIEIINGDVPLEARRDARRRFESISRFMISTEAGGEGVNLQKASHIMVNYDLPWNPMRLQQRVGRLDRYGQEHLVQVVNMRVPNSWDARISTRIMERLEVIQATMDGVTGGVEDFCEMLLGTVADQINPTALFTEQIRHGKDVDNRQIDKWLKDAALSVERWQEMFSDDLGLRSGGGVRKTELTHEDFRAAYTAALRRHSLKLMETRTRESKYIHGVYHYELPQAFRDPMLRPSREYYVVFDRDRYNETRDTVLGVARGQEIKPTLAGFSEAVTDWLFQTAFHAGHGQSVTTIRAITPDAETGWLLAYALRWQTTARRLLAPDSLCFVFAPEAGKARVLPPRAVLSLITDGKEGTPERIPDQIPDDEARAIAQKELKSLVMERGEDARSVAGLFLHAAIWVASESME